MTWINLFTWSWMILLSALLPASAALPLPTETTTLSCELRAEALKDKLILYRKHLLLKDHSAADVQLRALRDEVQGALQDPRDPCSERFLQAYLLGSLQLMESRFNGSSSNQTQILARVLLENRKIVWVRPELRASWSGLWNERVTTPEGELRPKVYGAYDCQDGIVYLDPNYSPYDLASIFTHEVAHLLRDKFDAFADHDVSEEERFQESGIEGVQNLRSSRTSLHEMLFLEEFFSILNGAFLQVRLTDDFGTVRKVRWSQRETQFPFDRDLSLFDRKGPLMDLWDSRLYRREKKLRRLDHFYTYSRWSSGTSFQQFLMDLHRELTVSPDQMKGRTFNGRNVLEIGRSVDLIAQRAASTYFGEGIELEPFFREKAFRWIDSFPKSLRSDPIGWFFRLPHERDPNLPHSLQSIRSGRDLIDELERRLHQKSLTCAAIEDSRVKGDSSGYLGRKLSHPLPPTPGADGNRPGADGNRPGADGNRPSMLVRPCLHSDHGI